MGIDGNISGEEDEQMRSCWGSWSGGPSRGVDLCTEWWLLEALRFTLSRSGDSQRGL